MPDVYSPRQILTVALMALAILMTIVASGFIYTAQTMPTPRAQTELVRYRIERIFEHEGCRVMRFWVDGDNHYYSTCTGENFWPQVEVPREVKP